MDRFIDKCANCLIHKWTPVEDSSKLLICAGCELIKYCGRDCQLEHWTKVHKCNCKFFKDPTKERQLEHKWYNCPICLDEAIVGPSQLQKPDNPNYKCIFDVVMKIYPPPLVHPHPFPVGGQPGDTAEKVILVLWQLLQKFVLTQPWTVNCHLEFKKVFRELASMRMKLWAFRKLSPLQYEFNRFPLNLSDIKKEVEKNEGTADPFELWKIIELVNNILPGIHISGNMHILIDPLVDIPAQFHALISQALSNNDKYRATVNQVLEALATQVIPFDDVLKIICDGSAENKCHFCSVKLDVANDFVVKFNCLYTGIYLHCGGRSCRELATSSFDRDWNQFEAAIVAVMQERCNVAMCDLCFRLPPVKKVHRCGGCLTVQYCSKKCLNDDWPIHHLFCKEDVEQRKKKLGKSGRRKEARNNLEELKKRGEDDVDIEVANQMIARLKFKNSENVDDADDHTPT